MPSAATRLQPGSPGIKVWAILLFVYCASGFLAGLGGVMSVARLYAANGLQLGQAYELDAIAAVILGGTSFVGGIGSIWGTLIGALIIAVLSNGLILTGVSDIWQFIIKGLVIIGAVASIATAYKAVLGPDPSPRIPAGRRAGDATGGTLACRRQCSTRAREA